MPTYVLICFDDNNEIMYVRHSDQSLTYWYLTKSFEHATKFKHNQLDDIKRIIDYSPTRPKYLKHIDVNVVLAMLS